MASVAELKANVAKLKKLSAWLDKNMLRLRGGGNGSLLETQCATLGILEEAISNAFTAALPLISSQSPAENLRTIAATLRERAAQIESADPSITQSPGRAMEGAAAEAAKVEKAAQKAAAETVVATAVAVAVAMAEGTAADQEAVEGFAALLESSGLDSAALLPKLGADGVLSHAGLAALTSEVLQSQYQVSPAAADALLAKRVLSQLDERLVAALRREDIRLLRPSWLLAQSDEFRLPRRQKLEEMERSGESPLLSGAEAVALVRRAARAVGVLS
jgi:hypothetical protein